MTYGVRYNLVEDDNLQLLEATTVYVPSSTQMSKPVLGHLPSSRARARVRYAPLLRELLREGVSAPTIIINGIQVSKRQSQVESARVQFEFLKAAWRAETSHYSMMTDKAIHPAYQQIIGMGKKVIPLILQDLQAGPDLWFWALTSLTGVDPVLDAHLGNIELMANDWVEWGITNGYISRRTNLRVVS